MNRALLMVLFLAVTLAAQTSEVELTAEPHHHLALQNSYVRVFKVEVLPKDTTLMHLHRHDYVYVTLGAAEISNEVQGKSPADIKLQDGETRFMAGNFSHSVRDLGATPFRNVTIEFLKPAKATNSTADDRGLEILDSGTEDVLFVKDGVRISEVQLNPGGTLPASSHARRRLIVSVSESALHFAGAGNKAKLAHMKAGDVQWLPTVSPIINVAKAAVRFITLDFQE